MPTSAASEADAVAWVVAGVRRIEAVCARHGVALAAAALQFLLGHPSVASVIPGPLSPEQVARLTGRELELTKSHA